MKTLYARLGALVAYLRARAADATARRRLQPEAGGLNALEIAVIAVVVVAIAGLVTAGLMSGAQSQIDQLPGN